MNQYFSLQTLGERAVVVSGDGDVSAAPAGGHPADGDIADPVGHSQHPHLQLGPHSGHHRQVGLW